MTKSELKALTDEMCSSINNLINNNTEISKEQFSAFLINSASLVSDVSQDELDLYQKSKDMLIKDFKEISENCLTSYAKSSSRFSELSKVHAQTITQFENNQIDVSSLTTKFNEIQTHMVDEINRANYVIATLTEQVQTLEKKSNLDSLTKVYNRNALNSYLSSLCLKATENYNTHLLILDIDDFKSINDTFGHIAGDKILIFLSNILKKTLRDGDKIFRYAGEAFIVILNRLDEEYCEKIGNRILKIISDNKLIYKGENIGVTASIGATKFILGDSQDSFISRADSALYKSKNNGKNQLTMELA